ncbi:hypothetical protein BH11ARM1_BH11ARM1_07030 [soil metagenome]
MVKIPDGAITVDGKKTEVKKMWVGQTEITWDVYDIFTFSTDLSEPDRANGVDAKSRPSRPYGNYDRGFGHKNYPAVGMALNGAEMFCKWLTKKTGKEYRLPTAEEWEYAARAGATSEPADLEKVAWYWDNSDDATHEVGKKEANAWGLFDVLGNACEWVTVPSGERFTKGGNWGDKKDLLTFTGLHPYDPKWQVADAQLPKSNWWYSDGPYPGLRVVYVEK